MSRYATPRGEGPASRPDPRPFIPMRRGGFSPLDLPFWGVALFAAAWLPHHVSNLAELVGGLAGVGIAGGIVVSLIRLRIHSRRSRPMVGPGDDQPFA